MSKLIDNSKGRFLKCFCCDKKTKHFYKTDSSLNIHCSICDKIYSCGLHASLFMFAGLSVSESNLVQKLVWEKYDESLPETSYERGLRTYNPKSNSDYRTGFKNTFIQIKKQI
jgi:hypothetical protein